MFRFESGIALVEVRKAFQRLTSRECEVLGLLASGLNNTQIAERLYITPKTVRNHVTHIYTKLGVENRAQAVIFAREAGLGQGQSEPTADNKFFHVSA